MVLPLIVMAPSGQMAMQCPHAMQLKIDLPCNSAAFPFSIFSISLQQALTQSPHPVQSSTLMLITASSLVRVVGMDIEQIF